jgi:predicted ester cyclase
MTREEISEFFARRDEAYRRHDVSALAADHAEGGKLHSPVAGDVKGRKAIQDIYTGWFSSFPDVEFNTEHLLIDGDRAAQLGKMIGTQKGEFCGLAPTGKRFEVHYAFLFLFEGGKIAHEIRIYDFTSVLLQLGVLKAKPGF